MSQAQLKEQLVGTWTLVSWQQRIPDGTTVEQFGPNPKGIAFFDAGSRFVITVMRSDRAKYAINNFGQIAESYRRRQQGDRARHHHVFRNLLRRQRGAGDCDSHRGQFLSELERDGSEAVRRDRWRSAHIDRSASRRGDRRGLLDASEIIQLNASEGWWARQDSNLQPDRYERPALTIELQAPQQLCGAATVYRASAFRQCSATPPSSGVPFQITCQTAGRIPAARFASEVLQSPLSKQRAQGMPGARRTHCLARRKKERAQAQHRYAEITPALPAQWLYGCSVLSLVCRAC